MAGLKYENQYKNIGMDIAVLIDGIDFTDHVRLQDIEIVRSIDFPIPTAYTVSFTDITLLDPEEKYSPERNLNIKIGKPVEIKSRFLNETDFETVFSGKIQQINYDVTAGTCTLSCADAMDDLFNKSIVNFGVPEDINNTPRRTFKLVVDETDESIHGVYPIPVGFLPLSDESITVKSDTSTTMTKVESLRTTGDLDHNRYVVTATGIETELPVPETAGYPQITCKSAYTWNPIKILIRKLIEYASVGDVDRIEIPKISTSPSVFNIRGPVANNIWNTITVGSEQGSSVATRPPSVGGFLTDFEDDGVNLYMSYSVPTGDYENQSLVLRWEKSTETYKVLYRLPKVSGKSSQVWGIAKDRNTLYLLCNNNSVRIRKRSDLPDVNPRVSTYQTYIQKLDIADVNAVTATTLSTASFPPINYINYRMGDSDFDRRPLPREVHQRVNLIPEQRLPFPLPDGRRGFMVHNEKLYYPYETATTIGVAEVNSNGGIVSRVAINRAVSFHGLTFDINNDTIQGVAVFGKNTTIKTYRFSRTL